MGLLYLPAMFAFSLLTKALDIHESGIHGVVAVMWLGAFGYSGIRFARFRCPLCGNRFFARILWNPWSDTCASCHRHVPPAG